MTLSLRYCCILGCLGQAKVDRERGGGGVGDPCRLTWGAARATPARQVAAVASLRDGDDAAERRVELARKLQVVTHTGMV